ncbi:Keratinocyte-associated protein 3 [Merluccius polli]|uniref:Keratinocyte-associated protein 3 n=1 Tax=Merluccius polli TaxID=89951 RepID=A0AA47N7L6_MERPO|nr:Keratinocyte-associated protein 3 [Merluccius polli]
MAAVAKPQVIAMEWDTTVRLIDEQGERGEKTGKELLRCYQKEEEMTPVKRLGVCCTSLKDSKALMKMGLGLVLVGHINFLLGALVHGAVLRHISVHTLARTMVYAISNVIAIVAGLVGIVCGITTIVLSKNKKNVILKWFLLVTSFIAGLLATASALGLMVSTVKAIMHDGRGLLTHCKFPDAGGYSSITNECPFDPTRIYGTTVILWVPLIVMSVVEVVFSFRCFALCTSYLYLCPCHKKPLNAKRVRIQRSYGTPESVVSVSVPDGELETPEQHELLDCATSTEQSNWL